MAMCEQSLSIAPWKWIQGMINTQTRSPPMTSAPCPVPAFLGFKAPGTVDKFHWTSVIAEWVILSLLRLERLVSQGKQIGVSLRKSFFTLRQRKTWYVFYLVKTD